MGPLATYTIYYQSESELSVSIASILPPPWYLKPLPFVFWGCINTGFIAILEQHRLAEVTVAGETVPIEFDGYISDLRVALEFQGVQHYFDTFIYGTCINTALHDQQKAFLAANLEIVLVEVPFWYSTDSPEQLLQVIKLAGKPQ